MQRVQFVFQDIVYYAWILGRYHYCQFGEAPVAHEAHKNKLRWDALYPKQDGLARLGLADRGQNSVSPIHRWPQRQLARGG